MFNFVQQHGLFAVLMAFVIGWSSLASATQKPKHAWMQMNLAHQLNLAETHAPCHANTAPASEALLHSQQVDEQVLHAECHDAKVNSHSACPECAFWHAQISLIAIDVTSPQLQAAASETVAPQSYARMTAQHLSGFWQEILRPPKTSS